MDARRLAKAGAFFLSERAMMQPDGIVPPGWWDRIGDPTTLRSNSLDDSVLGRLGSLVPGGMSYLGVSRYLGLDVSTEGYLGFNPVAARVPAVDLDRAWLEVIADHRMTVRLLIPSQG